MKNGFITSVFTVLLALSARLVSGAEVRPEDASAFVPEEFRRQWNQIESDTNYSRQQVYLSDLIFRLPADHYPVVFKWISEQEAGPVPEPEAVNARFLLNNAREGMMVPALARQPRNDFRYRAFSVLFSAWALHDPEAAMNALDSSEDRMLRERTTSSVLMMWVKSDWEGVLNWFANAEGDTRNAEMYLIVEEMVGRSPFSTLDWLSSNAPPQAKNDLTQMLFQHWGQSNPIEAISYVSNSLPVEEQADAFKVIARAWSETNPLEAISWIQNQPVLLSDSSFLREIIQRISNTDALAALRLLETANDPSLNENTLRNIVSNWANQDIIRAVEWYRTLPEGPSRTQAFDAMLYIWAQSDPVSLAKEIENMPGSNSTQNAVRQVARSWAEFDPKSALEWAESLKNVNWRQNAVDQVTSYWGSQQPQSAAAYVDQLENSARRRELALQLIGNWARQDANAAAEWIEKFEPEPVRRELYANFLNSLAHEDPQKAREILEGLEAPSPEMVTRFAQAWAQSGLNASLIWLRSLEDPDMKRAAFEGIVQTWARYSPQLALEFSRTEFPEDVTRRHLESILSAWSNEDPAAAAAYISEHASGMTDMRSVAQTLLSRWSNVDVAAAIEWFKQSPDFPGKMDAFYNISYRWVELDPTAAAEFALTLPPGQQRRNLLRNMLSNMANRDPEAAFELALKLTPVEERREALQSVFSNWANRSPSEAAAKVLSLEESLRNDLIRQVASNFANRDLTGAIEWMRSIEDEELQLDVFGALSGTWAQSQPDQVLEYANTITDPERRRNTMEAILFGWSQSDPEAAANHFLTLSPEMQTAINPHPLARNLFRVSFETGTEWIDQLPEAGDLRNNAVQGAVDQLANDSKFEQAATLALRMEGPAGRPGRGQNWVLTNTMRNWSQYDLDAAVKWLNALTGAVQIETAFSGIIDNWMERDPSAVAIFAEARSLNASQQLVSQLSQALSKNDPELAFKWAMKLPDPRTRSAAVEQVLPAYVLRDPEGTLQMILENFTVPGDRYVLLTTALMGWSQREPLAAANFLLNSEDARITGTDLFSMVVSRWARNDLLGATAWVEFQRDPEKRWNAFRSISPEWMRQKPDQALAFLKTFDSEKRNSILPEMVQRVDEPGSIQIAADYLLSVTDHPDFYGGAESLLRQWIQIDPDSAIAWFQQVPGSPEKAEIFQSIEDVWVRQHPESAVEFIAGQPVGVERRSMVQRFFSRLANQDAGVALGLARKFTPDEDRKSALLTVLGAMAFSDSDSAAKYVSEMPETYFRNDLLARVARNYARVNLEGALAWMKSASDKSEQFQIYLGLVSAWTDDSPEDAIKFLEEYSGPDDKVSALNAILSTWSQTAPETASEYLMALDAAVRQNIDPYNLARNFFKLRPVEAARWLERFQTGIEEKQRAFAGGIAGLQDRSDFLSAAELALQFPGPSGEPSPLEQAVVTWTEYDLKPAIGWMRSIEVAEEKAKVYSALFQRWSLVDPEAAREFGRVNSFN